MMGTRRQCLLGWIMMAILFSGCAREDQSMKRAVESITEADLVRHIQKLASDEFEGRAPATHGEELTIQYLKSEFERMGLVPGNRDSFFQEVPLVEITANPDTRLRVRGRGKVLSLKYADEYIAVTRRVVESVSIKNSEMVFVGYGIVAPEYGWNDYQGLDVKGKTVVMLVNDPGYATQDSTLFHGRSMTYYGRWTYKYEEAARQGAAGVIIIHQTGPAGYPWEVVKNSWYGPQFYLVTADKNQSRCAFEAWMTSEKAKELFALSGLDYQKVISAASQPDFQPISMNIEASLTLENQIRYSSSHNVMALLPGSDRSDEYIIYTAHWDHFGKNPEVEGDNIFNGALDNASGTAALLELAEAFTRLSRKPRRSIVLLAVTAEEQGLLGSAFYATHPVFPLVKTVAAINMDGLNIWGKMKDITIIGYGNSELDEYVIAAAREQGRVVRPDPQPEKGYFYRSDHFNFAKQGVPALYTDPGIDHVKYGEKWTLEQMEKWTQQYYHKPSDEYDPSWWDLSGAVDDVRLLFRIGYRLSMEDRFPNWREGSEFKARRDADLAVSGIINTER